MNHENVARIHQGFSGLFAAIALIWALSLPFAWWGGPLTEWGGYLGASGAGAFLTVAAIFRVVARRPEWSEELSPWLAMLPLGMAMVRFSTFAWQGEVAAMASPALVIEVLVFSGLGALLGSASTNLRHGMMDMPRLAIADMAALKPALKLWLVLLSGTVVVVPLAFLGHHTAQVMMLSHAVSGAIAVPLFLRFGLCRGLGLCHVFAWAPPFFLAALEVSSSTEPYALWVLAWVIIGGLSLLIDTVDSLRFMAGDRAPMPGTGAWLS